MTITEFLTPWEFSPAIVVFVIGLGSFYYLGMRATERADKTAKYYWQATAFYIGLTSIYVVSHTYLDYLSQYMFWVHRFQHLVLHHLAPLLMILGGVEIIRKSLPTWLRNWSELPAIIRLPFEWPYKVIQHPVIAPIVFVGLIYLWLIPEIHFAAMLSQKLYYLMNWSMLIDGLLFWWLILGPDWKGEGKGFSVRIIMMLVVVVPQQLLGAYLTLSSSVIYDVYDVCGRAWPISPMADQIYGGIVTWIPASMMSVLGLILVLRRRLNFQKREQNERT
ncbi:MAG TPA: cytochrome c oxidase assembly protein [Cycloclasticus sp.]|jgi:putative membrane protein|nr:cytochrome c oxidase assembly protein [Cycloclasticus sp.]HIL91266.1 cytochrome c oxidase assembly protein [Cycloclasticus sp.]